MAGTSSPDQSPEPEGQPRSREQRLQALGQLAAAHLQRQDSVSSGASTGQGDSPEPRGLEMQASRPIWLRALFWLAIVVVVATIGGGVAVWRLQPHTTARHAPPPAQAVAIVPREDDMDCPHDLAWSPSGATLAVLGYDLDCVSASVNPMAGITSNPLNLPGPMRYVPGLINLYSTHNGGLIGQIHPDALILPHIKVPAAVAAVFNSFGAPPYFNMGIDYTHILWSSNGQRLAVTFSFYMTTEFSPDIPQGQLPPGYEVEGLLLTDLSGQHAQVFLHPLTSIQPAALVWDLTTGHLVPAQAATAEAPTPFASLSPALGYQWAPGGVLDSQSPLAVNSSPSPPLGPVGSPDGGPSFSLWQSGFVGTVITTYTFGQSILQNVPNFSSVISAWSPDGRYVAENVEITGLLTSPKTPAPASKTLAPYGWTTAPQVPVRDAALQQAIAVAGKNSFTFRGIFGFGSGILVSWRPDGRVLAVDAATSDDAVTLYDCATGKVLATLKPDLNQGEGAVEQNETNVLTWSPDGAQLAYYDTTGGLISLWSGSQLPKG